MQPILCQCESLESGYLQDLTLPQQTNSNPKVDKTHQEDVQEAVVTTQSEKHKVETVDEATIPATSLRNYGSVHHIVPIFLSQHLKVKVLNIYSIDRFCCLSCPCKVVSFHVN